MESFSYAHAYSRTLVVAFSCILVMETAILHLWIGAQYPAVAWVLSASSAATLLWLWRDDAQFRQGALRVDHDAIHIVMGSRWRGVVLRLNIATVIRPTWQDLPATGTAVARDYVNLTKPADPNVFIVLHDAVALRMFGLATKNVRRIGCHLDAPDEFVQFLAVSAYH